MVSLLVLNYLYAWKMVGSSMHLLCLLIYADHFQVDYTGVELDSPCHICAQNFSPNSTTPCFCTMNFTLKQPFEVSSGPAAV